MNVSINITILLVVLIIVIGGLAAMGTEIPSEMLVVLSSLSTYFVGIVTRNPANGGE